MIEVVAGDLQWRGPAEPGRRALGVPPGGVYDRISSQIANQALGLPAESVTGEFVGPLVIRAREPLTLAVAGAEREVEPPGSVFHLDPGGELRFGPPTRGLRSYLALRPGHHFPEFEPLASPTLPAGTVHLAFIWGPEADHLPRDEFLTTAWRATSRQDRTGHRLEGPALIHVTHERPSEPQVFGTIQIPPNGEPILSGPDGPTVGGYPRIGVVIDADLDRLAQLAPGTNLRFVSVSPEAAREHRLSPYRE